ncbi:MAG TPA: DUF2922 domain-containing protein [Syntrophomonadaceae bacterium]|nr:DUF2922 domain-containing protein [Syntrophomonadaceae bacterium]
MTFITELGGRLKVSLPDPRQDITAAEVEGAMNTIIEKNIFSSTTGDAAAIHSASVVSKDVEEIITA